MEKDLNKRRVLALSVGKNSGNKHKMSDHRENDTYIVLTKTKLGDPSNIYCSKGKWPWKNKNTVL